MSAARMDAIDSYLRGLGHEYRTLRVRADGGFDVVDGTQAAQTAADAWQPTAAERVALAAAKRGMTVPQIAALRAVAALAAGQTPPSWARTALAAEALRIDQDVS